MNKRTLQISFVVFFIFSAFLTHYFIRLGVVGMIASTYAFLETKYGITKKIPNFWQRRMYWQKMGIVFGIVHFVIYLSLFLIPYDAFNKMQEGVLIWFFFEYPLLLIAGFIEYCFAIVPFFDPFTLFKYKTGYYSLIILGTLAYTFFGTILGIVIDFIIYTIKFLKKEAHK